MVGRDCTSSALSRVSPGDVVGCGYEFGTGALFFTSFTHNRRRLPNAFVGVYMLRLASRARTRSRWTLVRRVFAGGRGTTWRGGLTVMSVAWLGAVLGRTNGSRRIQRQGYVKGTGRVGISQISSILPAASEPPTDLNHYSAGFPPSPTNASGGGRPGRCPSQL